MTSYRIIRDDTVGRVYDGRDDFITSVVDRNGARLCSAIATVMAAERGRASAPEDDVEKDDEIAQQERELGYWRGFPWLTPVLGSGCLRSPAERRLTPSSLAAGVAARLRTMGPAPAGSEAWETIGRRFTESLARRRMRDCDDGTQSRDAPSDEVAEDVDEIAARLVLIAALLTRFCHAARAIDPTAIDRMSDEVVSFRLDRPTVDDPYRLFPTVIDPLKDQLSQVSELNALPEGVQDRTGEVLKAVQALAKSLFNELNRNKECRVSLNSVRLATEAAWYFLVSRTDEYYGWTELLLGLILREPNPQNRTYHRKRPRYNDLQTFPTHVRQLFEAPTKARWRQLGRTLQDQSTDADISVHRAVARVLTAQASAAAGMEKGNRALPLPVAFSTSFDIELPMELWALRQSYSVALPVHVARPERREVDLCWLVGDVDYDQGVSWERGLDRVRHPTKWRLLASARLRPNRPVVVHLTGCPLYGLEELADGTEERRSLAASLAEAGLNIGSRSVLTSAVTIDEYLALRQSEIELFWAVSRSADAHDVRSRGLDLRLSHDGQLGGGVNRRYWIALGVPVGDPALRHRVMSPLTARWISKMAGQPGPPDETVVTGAAEEGPLTTLQRVGLGLAEAAPHNGGPAGGGPGVAAALEESLVGVAVNTSVDDDEAFLLSWLGLSVVRGRAVDFVPDLLDYALHLRAQGDLKRLQRTECLLQTGSRR